MNDWHLSRPTDGSFSSECFNVYLRIQPLNCLNFSPPIICVLLLQACGTLCNGVVAKPVHQAPLSMGFSRQEYRRGLSFYPLGDLPNAGNEPMSLMSPALAGGFFTSSTAWEEPSSNYLSQQHELIMSPGKAHQQCHGIRIEYG